MSESDYQEAVRRYKNMRGKGQERQRCQALSVVPQGSSYREVARILLVDEETLSRGVRQYQERGLAGLQNALPWGGEHGQRELSVEQVETLKRRLGEEALAGTKGGRGWTTTAVRHLSAERFGVADRTRGLRKLFAPRGWSDQPGRNLDIRRDPVDQARYAGETQTALAKSARPGTPVVPFASAQRQGYVAGTLGRRWNPSGQPPVGADGARQKRAANLSGAVPLGTGAAVAPFASAWQASDATIRWYDLRLAECPQGPILLWQDQASPHPSAEVAEGLETQARIEVLAFPQYTPDENPKEATWKDLKDEVSHQHWHETLTDLRTAIDGYSQAGKKQVVPFLQKFGSRWVEGVIQPLPQTV